MARTKKLEGTTIETVAKLIIHSNAYDPRFCPVHGILTCEYNGIKFTIQVNGATIRTKVISFGEQFTFTCEQAEPQELSWAQILQSVLTSIISTATTYAVNEVTYQKSEGTYCVN